MQLDTWADLSHVWSYKMNCGCVSQISMRAAQCDRMVTLSVWQLKRTPKAERKTAERKVWRLKGNTESLSSPFLLEQWNTCLGTLGNSANSAQENHTDRHSILGPSHLPFEHQASAPSALVLPSSWLGFFSLMSWRPSWVLPRYPVKIRLLCIWLHGVFFSFLTHPEHFTSYQDKADMSDNKFLLIAKESMAAELAHIGDERLGVRFEHTGGLSC